MLFGCDNVNAVCMFGIKVLELCMHCNFFLLFVRPTSEFPHPLSRVKQQVGYRVSLYYQHIHNIYNKFEFQILFYDR